MMYLLFKKYMFSFFKIKAVLLILATNDKSKPHVKLWH